MEYDNAFRERLERGAPVVGARATTFAPELVEVYGGLGFDFVWLDFEHTGASTVDSPTLENLSRAAEAGDTTLLVRLPSGDGDAIRKALDAGVRNVLIPRVETAAEVREAVAASRFSYDGGPGERGNGAGRSKVWGIDADRYAEREDASVTVGVMIENATAVDNLDDILSVPDLGFVFVGPSDLSVSLGHPVDPGHPEVEETADRIRAAALDRGVPVGCVANDAADAREAIREGYGVLRVGDEVAAAAEILGDRLDAIRETE